MSLKGVFLLVIGIGFIVAAGFSIVSTSHYVESAARASGIVARSTRGIRREKKTTSGTAISE